MGGDGYRPLKRIGEPVQPRLTFLLPPCGEVPLLLVGPPPADVVGDRPQVRRLGLGRRALGVGSVVLARRERRPGQLAPHD